ncbi:class I SAM-dependent methyltransferase [Amycolatopsis samaneae]|uniref:Class I SAM-dependent methyltransferase n=1 Tax=Amycolatopsis samaneae TaxID=664691 RepID=A0ABW5GRW0_9PSEU
MTDDVAAGQAPMDFDLAYQGDLPEMGITTPTAPWDIGGPQPAIVEFERAGRVRGHVLDAGCGTGGNALYLAGRGHRVTAIDLSGVAVGRGERLAASRGLDVRFAVEDAVALPGRAGDFDSIVDSALFHVLDRAGQREYLTSLHRATRPGATLNMVCMSEHSPLPGISAADLRAALVPHWSLATLRPAVYLARVPDKMFEVFGTTPPPLDDEGRHRLPAWSVTADRAEAQPQVRNR